MSIFDNEELMKELCSTCSSTSEALDSIGATKSGSSYTLFNKYAEKFGLSPPRKLGGFNNSRIPNHLVFVENSTYRGGGRSLKSRMLELGIPDKCDVCGLGPEWQRKKLNLHVDHINGINSDNRLENLRILCPNCHTQTDTFSGRNQKIKIYKCKDCEAPIKKKSTRCGPCTYKKRKDLKETPYTVWPSDEELKKLVWVKPSTSIAEDLGVSSNAVKKRCKRRGIETPPRGYWSKIRAKEKE